MGYYFTSESVTSGHPDKLCDLISDSILDMCLSVDSEARVAVEVYVKGLDSSHNKPERSFIIIGGEISMKSNKKIDLEKIARECAISVGYNDIRVGMDAGNNENCKVILLISQQSEEISQGVSTTKEKLEEQGAGDQGIIFGYADIESEKYELTKGSYMPLPILLSHKISLEMEKRRKDGTLKWARPDGKSQVTLEYNSATNEPLKVKTIVIAIQHDDMVGKIFENEKDEREFIKKEVEEKIIRKVIPIQLIDDKMQIIVNGTGRFCKGGPHADAGLTGRKVIVDTYGGSGRHGGGAFSGKDPSKVDRSAAYAARWAAKHVVASGLAEKCEIQLAYSIGKADPVSIYLNSSNTGLVSDEKILEAVKKVFSFRPRDIIKNLGLKKPIYRKTAYGGHFGRIGENDGSFSWEIIDQEIIKSLKSAH